MRKIWMALKARKKYIGVHLIILILSFGLFFVADAVYSTVLSKNVNKKSEILLQTIEMDKQKISINLKNVASSESLIQYLKNKDTANIQKFISDQKEKIDLSSLLVTDENGVVLTRASTTDSAGDYIFNTSLLGSFVVRGRDITAIFATKNFPLVISGGTRILYNGKMIGAVFGGIRLDDDYAHKLQEYLGKNVQIVFYSDKDGLTGATFNNKTKSSLEIYFADGNNWFNLKNGSSRPLVNGQYYFIKTINFPNPAYPQENFGGAVIFLPCLCTLHVVLSSLAIVLIFLIAAILLHRRYCRGEKLKRRVFLVGAVIIALLLLIAVYAFGQYYSNRKNIILNFSPPYLIYNSILQFHPDSDFFNINYDQKIGIRLSTGGEHINLVKIKISFDPTMIRVKDVLTNSSICPSEFFFEKKINNEKGEINISCGVASPGFKGENGTLAELLIQPIHTGEVVLKFDPESEILANDGLGTNVLRFAPNADYRIFSSTDNIEDLATKIIPYSSTHPNSEQWYNKNLVRFSWIGQEGLTYEYKLDKNLASVLTKPKITQNNFVSVTAPDDGVYYFYLAAQKDNMIGPISTYQLRIDTTPPSSPIIRASSLNVRVGDLVRFIFESSDMTSGLQQNYYVKIDNNIFMPCSAQLFLPFYKSGIHTVTVRVFDNANNHSDAHVNVIVKK